MKPCSLFAVLASVAAGNGEALYLEAIAAVGSADTAAWLRNALATPGWRAD